MGITPSLSGGAAATLAEMLDERRHLLEVGLRIFDSPVIADRVVQETYRRWYAIDDAARATIPAPRMWLTAVAGEICRDLHGSGGVGPVSDSSPPSRPRRTQRPTLAENQHTEVVRRFAAACEAGDSTELATLLVSDAEVVVDGGGRLRAALHPIHGADDVAEHVAALLAGQPCRVERVNDRAGLVLRHAGQAVGVVSLNIAETKIAAVWIVLNPDKLRNWQPISATPSAAGFGHPGRPTPG